MARLYSDLIDGSGRRYYFGLNSAPGGVTPATGFLQFNGLAPTIQEQIQVFRTPATAMLTMNGLGLSAEPHLSPATAALSIAGQIPALSRLRVITNALATDYTALPDNPPTLLTIMNVSPATGLLQFQALTLNVTQGGNILIVIPTTAQLSISALTVNLPRAIGLGALTISGLIPALRTTLAIAPDPAVLTIVSGALRLRTPFRWIEDDPVSNAVWIDDPRA